MKTSHLRSNQELFSYLVELGDHLQGKGESELAGAVKIASRFASGSQTEFLAEAQSALRKVRTSNSSALSPEQISEVVGILQQIQVAFIKIGGA
jgi:hypothetical protein